LFPVVYSRRLIPNRKILPLLFAALATAAFSQTNVERVAASADTMVDRLVVLKREHKLLLLSGEQVVKSYDVALGRGGMAPKRRQGDRRTPEGLYRIDYRNPASKFHLALHISYPQSADKHRARQLGADPGGDIMIHGLDPDSSWVGSYHRTVDWTDGCIAVTDNEMDEIWRLVPDGTPVEIRR
jgi:murein L,D-transpeptidase YafK